VRLYVALREAAHQRLFQHVPWLRGHVLSAVEMYAAGIRVNREAIEEAMGRVDPSDPESMQAIALEGIFTPEDTPAQKASLARLETALALVEGWVCHVVDSAAGERLPNVVRLAEAFRRRRAAGGPAEQTFAALVGLELRPRRLREAAALWAALDEHRGIAGTPSGAPDLLPRTTTRRPGGLRPLAARLRRAGRVRLTAPGGPEEQPPGGTERRPEDPEGGSERSDPHGSMAWPMRRAISVQAGSARRPPRLVRPGRACTRRRAAVRIRAHQI
jgi:hypothetical protein